MYKKMIEWWKNITLVLALPLMVVNTMMDYYNGWESRSLEKETARIQKQKDDAFRYHSHHFLDSYYVTKDSDGNTVKILEHEKGEIIIPDNLGWSFLDEYDETPQEKVDNVLTKVFKPIQNVVGNVTSWFKWHLWEKWMERKKREDLIEKGIRG
tara:strand:+ start:293 stop:754 length:462 start_codon:yes stop_codon:yes gene_type:complete